MISRSSHKEGPKRSPEQGQISIFFASSLIVLISIIAFVINIGLFVKAKINLQNATDAGAYAGAAVQARMLNRIGYLNWEMRNVYKEWMFKYYVLGNLNIEDVENTVSPSANGLMKYTMQPDPNINNATGTDVYNFPSVCIHYAGVRTNVCRRYAIPGIPRFEPTNLVGIDETTSSFIDAIVREKTDDCSKRSQLNYNVTTMWAFNIPEETQSMNAFSDAPQIASDRTGAWPKAMEIAIRVRNLENAVNRTPVQPVCSNPGEGMPGCQTVTQFETEKHFGNERPTKAFWSAYRNIGNQDDRDMKASFTLTELAPTPVSDFADKSLSTLLIPGGNISKSYLDLKLQLVNLATFFTALISVDNTLSIEGQGVRAEGACDVSKIAVPVPAYPMGFYKNPDLITYYAVKGEAFYSGLFNPFTANKIKLTAYAAAKPMGGRIGPALFGDDDSGTFVKPRNSANKRRSTPYISGLDLTGLKKKGTNQVLGPGEFAAGIPIPFNISDTPQGRFWIAQPDDPIGGWISGPGIMFGVPNLVYDFVETSLSPDTYQTSAAMNIIKPNEAGGGSYASGLYQKNQFGKFRSNLISADSPEDIKKSIIRARGPTRYEAANYTIPFPSSFSEGAQLDTFGFLAGAELPDGTKLAQMYAPLYGSQGDALYKTADDVKNTIKQFLSNQSGAIKKYRDTMNKVALSIFNMNSGEYKRAAERISDFNFSGAPDSNPGTCNSIAGAFIYLYLGPGGADGVSVGSTAGCPEDLSAKMDKFFNNINSLDPIDPNVYTMYYTTLSAGSAGGITSYNQLLTGYLPGGPGRGPSDLGVLSPPLASGGGTDEVMRRTGYSTKFVTIDSLRTSSGTYNQSQSSFSLYSEGAGTVGATDIKQKAFKNALDKEALGIPPTVNH
ncbi:MAG: Tad domain-containing protein [Proteobacteria bacterium]|jgi:hypothetical protein|nr:Tad domain-containing protein [Pseudomonadota bacterium]